MQQAVVHFSTLNSLDRVWPLREIFCNQISRSLYPPLIKVTKLPPNIRVSQSHQLPKVMWKEQMLYFQNATNVVGFLTLSLTYLVKNSSDRESMLHNVVLQKSYSNACRLLLLMLKAVRKVYFQWEGKRITFFFPTIKIYMIIEENFKRGIKENENYIQI